MTGTPLANGELIRTLIRAVDGADHDVIAALTAPDVHFRSEIPIRRIPKRSSWTSTTGGSPVPS